MDYSKLNKRLEHMLDFETDDFFVKIDLDKNIEDKLFDFQMFHVFNLLTAFRNNNIILDSSDTGTGKTYTTIALCKQLRLKIFIICPKPLISHWKNICKYFNVDNIGIVNYELIRNGKMYDANENIIECKYLKITQMESRNKKGNITKDNKYTWTLPRNSIVIFDEVHKCKNRNTKNAKLLLSAKNLWKVLMLSATVSDKPEMFHVFGYMLGCYKSLSQSSNWINGMIREDKMAMDNNKLSAINRFIFPNKGSRMQIKELGSKFPMNQVSADLYFVSTEDKIKVNKAFEVMEFNNDILKGKTNNEIDKPDSTNRGKILTEITKARQLLECIKIPIIHELIQEYHENGYNVVVFLNYTESIHTLAKLLKTDSIINGEKTTEEINENIKKFQNNETNILICNSMMTDGMSLHDLHGVPRVSLISPSFSAIQLIQNLGRISRAGAKTPALQRIIFCSGTCEEVICNRIKNKLQFLAKLNDNDLINIQ